MSRNLLNKYIWLLETIERHGRLSRSELNDLWLASDISGREPLARRTFYNYRNGIEEIFGISLAYNSATYEYFIENADATGELSGWLINSMSINGMLSDAGDIADRVMLEDVPSARRYLATVIDDRCNPQGWLGVMPPLPAGKQLADSHKIHRLRPGSGRRC